MFIYSVTTPRNVRVNFGWPTPGKANNITLLTGPNGSGKTDVLASIANVFHGRRGHSSGAEVHWAKRTNIRTTDRPLERDEIFEPYERVHLVAQTFSPFSRFPAARRPSVREAGSVFATDEGEEYTCVGFNQSSRVELRKLAFSVVQKALLGISEKPTTARVTFEVLDELGFKNGFALRYRATKYLMALTVASREQSHFDSALQLILDGFAGYIANEYFAPNAVRQLRRELKVLGVAEAGEYLRHSINMLEECRSGALEVKGNMLSTFEYVAFRDRHGMSSDFPYLQAFSVLSKLGLVDLKECELTTLRGGRVNLTNASSGQQQMLCSIFGLAAALEDDSIVLIDEPELSLHPRWQMNLFRHLETALEAVSGCHVIIATHSALVAQAATNHGISIYSLVSDGPNSQGPSSKRGNAKSVEGLLVDVFDTPVPNSLHLSKEIFKLVTSAESGDSADRFVATEQLQRYIDLYRGQGDGSVEMSGMLNKAMDLVVSRPD